MKHIQKYPLKIIVATILLSLFINSTQAQRDSSRRQTIEITSSYKPVLRNTAKINLYASPITGDTSKPRLAYSIPAQNLFFTYQPVSLKPLALDADTALNLGDRNQLKVGFGSFTTPYVAGAFSFGDGKKNLLNLYGNYISSRGNITNQDFSQLNLKAAGSLFTPTNEIYAHAAFSQHENYLYGYDHTLDSFKKADIRRSYQDFSAGVGYRNIASNNLKFVYDPHLEVHEFSRESKASESTIMLNIPVEKKFTDNMSVKITALGDFNSYKLRNTPFKLSKNLFQLAPEFVYYSDAFNFHAGVTPSWNNSTVNVLPNFYGEAQLQHNVLMVQAGWIGRYITNSFRTLSGENPYMQDPNVLKNTKEVQYYGGIKATLGKHFSFNARAAFITYNDMPLFINDTLDGKSFIVKNERRVDDVQIHGDLNFISQDKFTLTGALDLNTYTGLLDNSRAWGLVPLKVTGSLRWNAFKQVLIKGDIIAFSGAKALSNNGSAITLKGGTDISAGAEFKITSKFSAWLDLDNILNSKYQRWNNYPVYGFQVIGGLLVHF